MQTELNNLKTNSAIQISESISLKEIEEIKIGLFGKKGKLTNILKKMSQLSGQEKPIVGKLVNQVKQELSELINNKIEQIKFIELQSTLESENIDVTIPGLKFSIGKRHPLSQILNKIQNIFIGMGFQIETGPEIETDYYNFEALNIPKEHPARDTQDTFYINNNTVLRTQTSPIQVRIMESTPPPIRVICPGKVYRSDSVDSTHSPVFHQIEGLVIDKNIKMSDLKGTIDYFIKNLYDENTKTRFRPHHFPFTEPSAEVDVMCFSCNGAGCNICKNEGYIEILGCGMVHPQVLKNCGIDHEIYSGFAFGLGLERIVMKKFDINDLRLFFENDIRFLNAF